ncbi:MAG: hypothetical protein AAB869_00470, partial [Patescibacteria group bacterium]
PPANAPSACRGVDGRHVLQSFIFKVMAQNQSAESQGKGFKSYENVLQEMATQAEVYIKEQGITHEQAVERAASRFAAKLRNSSNPGEDLTDELLDHLMEKYAKAEGITREEADALAVSAYVKELHTWREQDVNECVGTFYLEFGAHLKLLTDK